jgi:hypothetical protein
MPAALRPKKPWQNIKATLFIGLNFYQDTRSLYNPIASVKHSLKYAYSLLHPEPPPHGSLEVAQAETDARGFAIYGTVRVAGRNVIPPC